MVVVPQWVRPKAMGTLFRERHKGILESGDASRSPTFLWEGALLALVKCCVVLSEFGSELDKLCADGVRRCHGYAFGCEDELTEIVVHETGSHNVAVELSPVLGFSLFLLFFAAPALGTWR